jgi:hypothetical protein
VLSKRRRRQPGVALRSVYQNWVTYPLQPTGGLVLVLDNNSACQCVRVVKQLSNRIDRRTGNADARKRVIPVCDRMLRYRGLDVTNGFYAVIDSISIRPELRIIDDRTQPRDSTKLAPQVIVRYPYNYRAFGSLEGLLGEKRLVA